MTLVVGGIDGNSIWLLGDTAITGGTIEQRQKEFCPKIELSPDKRSVAAFAGSYEFGMFSIREGLNIDNFDAALSYFCDCSRDGHVSFLYAYVDKQDMPFLFRIENGAAENSMVAHIGSRDAFEVYQRIKIGKDRPYAPEAYKQLLLGAQKEVPQEIQEALSALIDLFASYQGRDVGGWATPFILRADYATMLSYAYSVSDPLFTQWVPGNIIPHGTASAGGATLSVTLLPDERGHIVYWLQKPGGIVCVKTDSGYELKNYLGDPSSFKAEIEKEFGFEIDLWVTESPPGPLNKILIKRDAKGSLESTVGFHGNSLTFALHNLATPFKSNFGFNMDFGDPQKKENKILIERMSHLELRISIGGSSAALNASEIEDLTRELGIQRSNLYPSVPVELKGVSCLADVDPAWRVESNIHPGAAGANLALRHKAYGWQSYILPIETVRVLGEWLVNFARRNT